MDPQAFPTPSPTAAWIAATLAAITLPIAAHPIHVLYRQARVVGYPVVLNSTTPKRHGIVWVWNLTIAAHVCLIAYSVACTRAEASSCDGKAPDYGCETGYVIQSFIPAGNQGPFLRAWIDIHTAWGGRLFQAWFLTLVVTGVASLALTIRLIPWLQKREDSSASRESRDRGIANGSATSRASGVTLLAPLNDPSGSPSKHHQSTASFKSMDWLQSTARHLRARTKSEARSATRARLHACLRRLRVCLALILLVLGWNVVMVFTRPFPTVLHVTIGWVSCRMISVLLFAATREIRLAVVTRRQIPNTEAGTLAATGEWDAEAKSSRAG
ncbi:hypothetical protein BCR44DRAFT_55168 [Catenaria anguillulae PL171]|uniref:Uncharacterized protein n=1 Tax=Catenaria anguillulae PL171 TaxID=765915 RepID=A0A1Y2H861_9FUNG|nr:hypothetical protein BCR44DRAFT_55168 [Catenaria anguillulae PL171]